MNIRKTLLYVAVLLLVLTGCANRNEETGQGQEIESTQENRQGQEVSVKEEILPAEGEQAGTDEQEMNNSIVKIIAEEISGSGVIYERTEEQLVIATAGHVLEKSIQEGEAVTVVFEDGYFVETASCIISQTSEAAFLNIDLAEIPEGNRGNYAGVKVDKTKFDALAEGEQMELAGAETNMSGTMIYPWIFVEDFNQYMMLVQAESVPGMSGGGLFDEDGNFAGILCGVNENGETAVIPLSIIMAEYAQIY